MTELGDEPREFVAVPCAGAELPSVEYSADPEHAYDVRDPRTMKSVLGRSAVWLSYEEAQLYPARVPESGAGRHGRCPACAEAWGRAFDVRKD